MKNGGLAEFDIGKKNREQPDGSKKETGVDTRLIKRRKITYDMLRNDIKLELGTE